jgi:hypothetical protein
MESKLSKLDTPVIFPQSYTTYTQYFFPFFKIDLKNGCLGIITREVDSEVQKSFHCNKRCHVSVTKGAKCQCRCSFAVCYINYRRIATTRTKGTPKEHKNVASINRIIPPKCHTPCATKRCSIYVCSGLW